MIAKVVTFIALLACLAQASATVAEISVDDFLPPVKAKSEEEKLVLTKVAEPNAVEKKTDETTGQEVVAASSTQDAINAALTDMPTGCQMIMVNGSRGWVASGTAPFHGMPNPNATKIAKRQAFVRAFMEAKKQLAQALNGISSSGKSIIRDEYKDVETAESSLTNVTATSEEAIEQTISGILRGYVLYNVADNTENGSVSVSIVTTPKTRGQFIRPGGDSVVASDLRAGIEQVLDEIKNQIVPLIGGRLITIPTTNEVAFVGFGSAVISQKEGDNIQAKVNIAAEKIARVRAQDALLSIIEGEEVSAVEKTGDSMTDTNKEFEELCKDDPVRKSSGVLEKELEKKLESFRSSTELSSTIQSLRSGTLPPGIVVKTFSDVDNAWMQAVAMYIPSLSDAAAEDAKAMEDAKILQPHGKSVSDQGKSKESEAKSHTTPHPAGTNRPVPSGRVTPDSEL